ncbi:UNVERIFIED_CONTAM: hypothetical protein NCL1_47433 [Trichonephila clavipes]
MDVASNTTKSFRLNEQCIGELRAPKCRAEIGQINLIVTLSNSPNHRAEKIIEFIHKNTVAYTVKPLLSSEQIAYYFQLGF